MATNGKKRVLNWMNCSKLKTKTSKEWSKDGPRYGISYQWSYFDKKNSYSGIWIALWLRSLTTSLTPLTWVWALLPTSRFPDTWPVFISPVSLWCLFVLSFPSQSGSHVIAVKLLKATINSHDPKSYHPIGWSKWSNWKQLLNDVRSRVLIGSLFMFYFCKNYC
jgi:hypothetical protein